MTRRRRGAEGRGPWIAVAGTRPNYVKLAPLVRAAKAAGRKLQWIDTGQHTARALSRDMAADLKLPAPVVRLRAPRTQRVPRLAERIGAELEARRPSLVVVVGDVDSTLAAALAAYRLDLPLAHVEAGLRSFERDMPEERNRVLVDHMSDRLYLSEPMAEENLRREGVARARIRKPGNVMADALHLFRPQIDRAAERWRKRTWGAPYVVATLHRQANVDDPRRLSAYAERLAAYAGGMPVVFPVHPRTRKRLAALGLLPALKRDGVRVGPPRPYLDFLGLVSESAFVITDSGGLQVEAALLGVPCVTARRRTEHQLTVAYGGNVVAGTDPRRLSGAVNRVLARNPADFRRPRAWDGRAAERIVADWVRGFARPRRLPSPDSRLLRAAGVPPDAI